MEFEALIRNLKTGIEKQLKEIKSHVSNGKDSPLIVLQHSKTSVSLTVYAFLTFTNLYQMYLYTRSPTGVSRQSCLSRVVGKLLCC